MKFIQKTKEKEGSILIESIVGISLVTIGIVGIITLLTRSSSLYNSAVNELKATYLGAEGIEVVKNIIDTKYINKLPSILGRPDYYYVDNTTLSGSFTPLTSPPVPEAADFVSVNSVTTIFRRIIKIQNTGSYLDVKSYVSWSEAGSQKQIILEDNFYPWRPNLQ